MYSEITELEKYGTWNIIQHVNISKIQQSDGNLKLSQILSGIWSFCIKQFSDGLLRKIKTRFCARDDLQKNIDVFNTYVSVVS